MQKELLTTTELSKILRISRRTIEKYRKIGMPFYLTGPNGKPRFDLEEVQNWMKECAKEQVENFSF
ncbi:helix-turn-helix transcriptional regulator [Brevibacillus thermoruber]|uniref:helix-turn-helix transcriptional regulator n=1 Tax=Brevibacillus thermoruber TaxID=33942 RepID=UPI000555035C|nr:helix-turn-helix domain-containing protein [Brevibacillus thermoruber]